MNLNEQLIEIGGYLNDLQEFKKLPYDEIIESQDFKDLFEHISFLLMDNVNLALICNKRCNYFENLYSSKESIFIQELQKAKKIIFNLLKLLNDKKLRQINCSDIINHNLPIKLYLTDYFNGDFNKKNIEANFQNIFNLFNKNFGATYNLRQHELLNTDITKEWIDWLNYYVDFFKELNNLNAYFVNSSIFTIDNNDFNELFNKLEMLYNEFNEKIYETPKSLYIDNFIIFNELRCNVIFNYITFICEDVKPLINSAIRVLKELKKEILRENSEEKENDNINKQNLCEIKITKREKDVFDCLMKGQSNKLIAENLKIKPSTVEKHINSILKKSECSDSKDLIVKYRR